MLEMTYSTEKEDVCACEERYLYERGGIRKSVGEVGAIRAFQASTPSLGHRLAKTKGVQQ